MLRKANELETKKIIEFLNQDSENNFFLIGDIEAFGLHSNIHTTFIFELESKIKYVILIYNQTLLYFDPYYLIDEKIINYFIEKEGVKNINISSKMFENLSVFFNQKNRFDVHKQIISKLEQKIIQDKNIATKAQSQDIELIVKSRMKIDEFKDFRNDYEKELKLYKQAFDSNVSNPFIIKINNEVVSCALIAINAANISIIGGVFTLEEHRKKGYASQVVSAVSNFVIENNRIPMLFYHNQKAGKIYEELGYKPIGHLYTIVVK
ncbi:N-acetyltransferase [Mycoplasmopsis bovigenitalium]|uniref:GNAT family N-acetyltransferase n=1 Tax=Mycoplasmopsis bovigenitalium TaxID=2112 RepID=UPI000909A056|nr:GNAT family N-acetyltransferase [Mycoplasmopsis bovigenitalium]BAW18575.1 N-acetyltransferase [Mycoplasmopsis bovigenitalium]